MHGSTFMRCLELANSQRQKVEQRLPWTGEKGEMRSSCLMGVVSVWNEKVVEMDGSDHYTTS